MIFKYNRYQINNPSVELAREIAKTAAENNSGIQPVYKSIKNIRPKTVQDLMKNIRPIMDFFARDFAWKHYSAPKIG